MDVLRLPFGPWYLLFGGEYEGTHVSLYQNPDRDFLSVIVDTDESKKPRGLVLTMYKGFLAEGPVQQLLEGMKQNAYLFITKRGENVHRFLLIVEGPKYIGLAPEELSKAIEAMGNSLYREQIVVRELAKAMSVTLTALRDVPKRVAALLLAEPLVMPKMAGGRPTIQSVEEIKHVALGKNRDGLVAKEPVTEFRALVISGEHEKCRKHMLAITVENYALAGIPVILFTEHPERWKGLKNASNAKLAEYGIAPVGFPMEVVTAGNGVYVDLNTVDKDALMDLMGISSESDVAKLITKILETGRGEFTSTKDLEERVTGNQYVSIQARRVLEVTAKRYSGVFGKNSATQFLTATEVGGITVVGMKEHVADFVAAHTLLTVVTEFLRKRGRKGGVAVVFEDADRLLPRVESPVVNALVRSVIGVLDVKGYVALEVKDEGYLPETLATKIETRIITVADDEAGIRMLTKRPYRFVLRPTASSITV